MPAPMTKACFPIRRGILVPPSRDYNQLTLLHAPVKRVGVMSLHVLFSLTPGDLTIPSEQTVFETARARGSGSGQPRRASRREAMMTDLAGERVAVNPDWLVG